MGCWAQEGDCGVMRAELGCAAREMSHELSVLERFEDEGADPPKARMLPGAEGVGGARSASAA